MNHSNKVEVVANCATIVAALLVSAAIVKVYFVPGSSTQNPFGPPGPGATTGTSLAKSLPGIDWKGNGRTLVLAISTSCHFCTESAPFYRRLQAEVGKSVKLVAVLPQSATEAQQYLSGEGVQVTQVKQIELGELGVQGTPTLLLVNSSGVVTNIWAGKVRSEDEDKVLSTLKG